MGIILLIGITEVMYQNWNKNRLSPIREIEWRENEGV